MTFYAGVCIGWVTLAVAGAFVLGAIIRFADYMEETAPPKQPAGVRDPETQLLWDEDGRLVGESWSAR